MQDKRVGIISSGGRTYSAGIGRIAVPPEVDRDIFVRTCLTNGVISLQPEVGSILHRVRCDKWILQQIDFPNNEKEFGSLVVFVNDPKSKVPYVIACIDTLEEYRDLKENQFRLEKNTDQGVVTIIGDGNGRLSINVASEENSKGRIDLNVSNNNSTAKLKVNIKGTAEIYSSGKLSVQTNDEVLLEATDGTDKSTISLTKNRINFDEGSEPFLLGQTTIDLLKEFINLVATATNAGGPLSTAAQISELATQLDNLLSKKSNLD